MTPQVLSPNHERGFYIIWDTTEWRKDRVSTVPTIATSRIMHADKL